MKKTIAIIFGGNNSEHEVSLASAGNVVEVVDCEKYNVIYVAILKNGNWVIGDSAKEYLANKSNKGLVDKNDIAQFVEMTERNEIDLVLPILHGAYGEDGRLQGFLDVLGVKYVFSGHSAHAVAMDKSCAKKVVEGSGVQIIPGITLQKGEEYNQGNIINELGSSLFVKPSSAGSSVGISKVENEDELIAAIKKAFKHDDAVVIEKTIEGRELTVGIIDNIVDEHVRPEALPVIEIIPKTSDWYDYESKYADGGSEHICPAEISTEVERMAKEHALKAYNSIGCKDFSRVDFLLDEKSDQIYFLEINTIPGMTSTSLVPDAARVQGIEFDELINDLIKSNL